MRNDATTNDAAAYKAWLTKQVQEAIDDPNPSVPHAQVAAEWEIEHPIRAFPLLGEVA